VGITRAKEKLYLTYATSRLYFGERTSNPPSRFITDIPENLLESIGSSYSPVKKENPFDIDDAKSDFDDIIEKYLK
jgi:DNA helicase-2/ATP-dependent DNA helicase PcrA